MYISSVRIPITKLRKFVKGGAITISPNDLTDQASKKVNLVFSKLKDQRRMLRNFHLGKGFVLKADHVNDIEDGDEGGSLLTKGLMKLQHGLEKIGQPMEKAFGGFNPAKVGYQIGLPIGNELRPLVGKKKLSKSEMHDLATGGKINAKKVGRKIKDAFEKVGKVLAKEGKKIAKNNKGELQALAQGLVSQGVDTLSGNANDGDFGRAVANAGRDIGHMTVRDVGYRNGVYNSRDDYQHGQYKKVPVATPVDEEVGSGLNSGLGGNRLLRNSTVNPSAKERMAHARSFRKKGGSMRPLGGSIMPL